MQHNMSDPDEVIHAWALPVQPLGWIAPFTSSDDPTALQDRGLDLASFYLRDALYCLRGKWAEETVAEHFGGDEQEESHSYGDSNISLAKLSRAPLTFIHEYFAKVRAKQHTLGREFDYINYNQYNRMAFFASLDKVFQMSPSNATRISILDFANIVELVCPNIPPQLLLIVAKIARHGHAGCSNVEPNDACFDYDNMVTGLKVLMFYQEVWVWIISLVSNPCDHHSASSFNPSRFSNTDWGACIDLFSFSTLERPNGSQGVTSGEIMVSALQTLKEFQQSNATYIVPPISLLENANSVRKSGVSCGNTSCKNDNNSPDGDESQCQVPGHFFHVLFQRKYYGTPLVSYAHATVDSLAL